MGRFSPTVTPEYYHKPSFGEHIVDVLENVNDIIDRRRAGQERRDLATDERELKDVELAGKGIFRGQAPGLDVDVRAPVMEDVPLPPAFNPDEEHPLMRSRRGMDLLRDSLGGEDDALAVAGMLGTAARRPPPPRAVPPGAYNPIRGTFEPAIPLPVGGLELDVTAPDERVRQLTDNYFIDERQTPAGREAALEAEELARMFAEAREAGLLTPEDEARARILGVDEAIGYRDELAEEEGDLESNRANWTAYNERLRAMGEPEVPFDPRTNYAQQSIYLGNDLRNETQLRTRPRIDPAEELGITGAEARATLDDLFGGENAQGSYVPGTQVIPQDDYERYYTGLVEGTMTLEDVIADSQEKIQAEALEALEGRGGIAGMNARILSNRMRPGGAPGTPTNVLEEARTAVEGLPREDAENALREAGFSDTEIAEILP